MNNYTAYWPSKFSIHQMVSSYSIIAQVLGNIPLYQDLKLFSAFKDSRRPSITTIWMFSSARQLMNNFRAKPSTLRSQEHQLLHKLPSGLATPESTDGSSASKKALDEALGKDEPKVRIGIIGGGITGVSAAHALVRRGVSKYADITVFEGGMPENIHQADMRSAATHWKSATARNGQSIVPGASFYVYSTPAELGQVITDTMKEWYWRRREQVAGIFGVESGLARQDNFNVVPPYFSLQLGACLGPSATHDERMTFIRFGINYLYTAFLGGSPDERGRAMLKLSLSNQALYDAALAESSDLERAVGHSRGFMSFFRTYKAAESNVRECMEHGIVAEHVSWDDAICWEPRVANIPIRPLFAVRRPNDYTANSNEFVRHWRTETSRKNVRYVAGHVSRVKREGNGQYQVSFTPPANVDGNLSQGQEHYDILVLSAGIDTPLLARQLEVGRWCPVYPMRGFSLTIFVDHVVENDTRNLLRQAFKVDAMYSSSVSPYTARWVGFGEFAGYAHQSDDIKSIAPKVLTRYAQALFPEAEDIKVEQALPCYRSFSPDDLPIVGPVKALPGLFIHTGHGTLGWSSGLATGDMLAQQIERDLSGKGAAIVLADGSQVDEHSYSPNRFL